MTEYSSGAPNTSADCPNLSGLTQNERNKVISVLQRAKAFEDEENQKLRQPMEGQLTKFTNVVKGWLPRWFVLDPQTGILEYFEKEEHKSMRPRGSLYLAGAVVCPSDEDSQTFSVHASNGEIIRIKAQNAKNRQLWVDRLRSASEFHTASLTKANIPRPEITSPSSQTITSIIRKPSDNNIIKSHMSDKPVVSTKKSKPIRYRHHMTHLPESLKMVKEHQLNAEDLCNKLHKQISDLPHTSELGCFDPELLILKATSTAALKCVSQCFHILQQQNIQSSNALPSKFPVRWFDAKKRPSRMSGQTTSSNEDVSNQSLTSSIKDAEPLNHESEVEDVDVFKDCDLGSVDEYKPAILGLLSQLKLGMDLTKVVLPTFVLEKRSLLEMFADCMSHPHLFLRISDFADPEKRMIAVLHWYLSSFHAGRRSSIAKKPYNPIIGEVFRCSWKVSSDRLRTEDIFLPSGLSQIPSSVDPLHLIYCAEQVSHHPPVSAFYFESPEQQMCLSASLWMKSKFKGMSITMEMIGPLTLMLLRHNEEYNIGLPSVFSRSILTVPWLEMGDRVSITCPQSGCTASVTFHTKPFYGGHLHKVTAEVKNMHNSVICKVQGEWNSNFDFIYPDGQKDAMDVTKLSVFKKRVRPLNQQKPYESRQLWKSVTNALLNGDIAAATKHKQCLEEKQRLDEKHRKESGSEFPTLFFHKVDNHWHFKKTLTKNQTSFSV